MAETTTLKRSNPFGSNYRVVAGNNPKVQNNIASGATAVNQSNFKKSLPFKIHNDYNLNGNDINKLRTMVNRQNINDRANYAYDVALNLARRDQENDRRTRGFANFNTEADLTSKADEYYDQLMQGAEHLTGAQMRGENAFTQALGGIREGINGFNNMIGTGIDWGVDRFGDLVGAVTGRDDWKQSIQDATTGEDLAIIPDILEDIGLVALTGPVGGAALLGAKGLLQNTDNFQEALTGIDHITGERLTGGQRLANTAAGLGGTALTMLPGFSAAKAGEKLITKGGEKAISKAEKMAEQAAKMTGTVDSLGSEAFSTTVKGSTKAAKKGANKAIENIRVSFAPQTMKVAGKDVPLPTPSGSIVVPTRMLPEQAVKSIEEASKAIPAGKVSVPVSVSPHVAEAREIFNEALGKAKTAAKSAEDFSRYLNPEEGRAIPLALRNPFSREAREYNRMAKDAYKDILKREYALDRDGGRKVLDKDGNVKLDEEEKEILEKAGGTRKAIWNLINGKTLGKAAMQKENVAAAKEAAKAIQESDTKGIVQGLRKMLSNEGIRKATKGQQGKGVGNELFGPGAIKGFGLTAGSGLAEVMANEPGGFQAAINNYADTMGQTPDSQLLPLALAMLPGYRKGFARMFGGNTLPYYGVKAQLAQRGVNNVYNNRYTDEDNENLLKAIGGK